MDRYVAHDNHISLFHGMEETMLPYRHVYYKADEVDARIQELEEENEQLDVSATERQLEIYRFRKALEFYADSETYKENPPLGGDQKHIDPTPIEIDEGERATEALKEEK